MLSNLINNAPTALRRGLEFERQRQVIVFAFQITRSFVGLGTHVMNTFRSRSECNRMFGAKTVAYVTKPVRLE